MSLSFMGIWFCREYSTRGIRRHRRDSNYTLDRGARFSHRTTIHAINHSRANKESNEDDSNSGTSLASRLCCQGKIVIGSNLQMEVPQTLSDDIDSLDRSSLISFVPFVVSCHYLWILTTLISHL